MVVGQTYFFFVEWHLRTHPLVFPSPSHVLYPYARPHCAMIQSLLSLTIAQVTVYSPQRTE